jgi:hypothetical protein
VEVIVTNSHYLPACYLKHFARPVHRYDGCLYVYDRTFGKSWPSNPHKTARENHFYDVVHQDVDVVEGVYSDMETRFDRVLIEINKRGTLPTESSKGCELLSFVATQATRTPSSRELLRHTFDEGAALVATTAEDSQESFAKRLKSLWLDVTQQEVDRCFDTRHEFMAGMRARGGMVDQTTLVTEALHLAEDLEPILAERYWILGVAPNDDTQFITCDNPVLFQPAGNTCLTDPHWVPAFDDPDTNVIVALSPRLSLIGCSRASHRARKRLTRREVALVNTNAAFMARRFIYSAAPTFAYVALDRSVVNGPPMNYDCGRTMPCAEATSLLRNGAISLGWQWSASVHKHLKLLDIRRQRLCLRKARL